MQTDSEGVKLREEALNLLEEKRHEWIAEARKFARQLLNMRSNQNPEPTVTSDDLWVFCPPPSDINPVVMGAVFRKNAGFKPLGFVQSKRKQCHGRPIREWTFA
tara:strand:+ start:195 stop:506 length:312 start_codon:yes stop_codon:yes gene_type:complete